MKRIALGIACLLVASVAQAAPISIYTAPDNTYGNSENNPCLFYGPGGSGCNQDPAGWPDPTGDTGGGDPFNPYPLEKSFSGTDLLTFAAYVGRDFFIGLDINQADDPQTLDNLTINFYNSLNVNIGSFTFSPATLVPDISNGVGYADYILAAGCAGTVAGSGVSATCTNYSPFVAPTGTRRIDFTFGLTGYNDGGDKLFLISAGPTPTPFDVDPTAVPEPGSMVLLGTGLFALAGKARQRLRRRQAMEKA